MIGSASFWLGIAWLPLAAGLSAAGTRWLVGWTTRHAILDVPNERSSHARATPRGGGVAIVGVTTLAGLLACGVWAESRPVLLPLIMASLGVAYVSWLDDLKPLSNRIRFGTHLVAALVVIWFSRPLEALDFGTFGRLDLGIAAWPLTILWIVGMTNAFNFMDGIDGIAGITAAIAGLAIAVAAACMTCSAVSIVGFGFAGASLGFLAYNWPPARIFMGDVGSSFCGFVIAAVPLALPADHVPRIAAVVAITMWPFIFDTAFTLLRRVSRRENIFEPHRSHIYQRLVISGWSHRAVSSLYGGLSAMAAAVAVCPLLDPACTHAADNVAVGTILGTAALLIVFVSITERTHLRTT